MGVKVGDVVRFLDSVGGGRVTKIINNIVYVEDEDGFEIPAQTSNVVVTATAEMAKNTDRKENFYAPAAFTVPKSGSGKQENFVEETLPDAPETAEGEKLNLTLAFLPVDAECIETSDLEVVLVNDSNYRLLFSFSSGDGDRLSLRRTGELESATEITLVTVPRKDIAGYQHILLQAIAFKRAKDFDAKAPVSFDTSVDVTKFSKRGCYKSCQYFDIPAIAFTVVKDDVAAGNDKVLTKDSAKELAAAMKAKQQSDRRPVRKSKPAVNNDEKYIVDLHATELLDSTAGMGPAEILNYQIDKFREVMDDNLRHPGRKIVFIHGKGEGTLRHALLKELSYRYKECDVCDASFKEYGYGATQVTIGNVKPGRR